MEQPIRLAISTASEPASALEGTLPTPPDVQRGVHGWLLPSLLRTDTLMSGRWDYLAECWERGELLDKPIPKIHFLHAPDRASMKMLTTALDAIPNYSHGGWAGWSGSEHFRFFLSWILHGLGHSGHMEPPTEAQGCEGARDRLSHLFDLSLMAMNPYDYFGDLLAENLYGRRGGFFPTPHSVAELLAQMTIGVSDGDTRTLTVCDPCVGTGRLLLHASNFSLRLYGQDIDPTLCLATLVNGFLYAPWLVRPLPYLDGVQYNAQHSAAISEAMVAQAPPHQAEQLIGTEHDTDEQWRFEPVKKRRRLDPPPEDGEAKQGILF